MDHPWMLIAGRLFLIAIGLWAFVKIVSACRTGVLRHGAEWGGSGKTERETQPLLFWLSVTVGVLAAAMFIAVGVGWGDIIVRVAGFLP